MPGPLTDTQLRAAPVPIARDLPASAKTGDAGTKTASFAGKPQTNTFARGALITVVVGEVTGPSASLACQLQWSPDDGGMWLNLGSAMTIGLGNQAATIAVYPTALTAGLGAVQINAPLPRTWRLAYAIGGTKPSVSLTAVHVNYLH